LSRKGLLVDRGEVVTEQTVGDLMRAPVTPVRETTSLSEIAARFLSSQNNFLPVVDADNQLLGVVALQDLKEYLGQDSDFGVIAADVMRPSPASVTPNQRLLEILPLALSSELRNIPVVNSLRERLLVGSQSRAEVLGVFSEAIATRNEGA
jgi:CBS domain-containing protein